MGRNNSKQSSNCCHCNYGSQYRYCNIGNSLHNTFLFIKRLSVFFIPFSKQNCIIYSGTQLDGTDNKICNIENVFSKPSTENAEQSASFLKGFMLQFVNMKIYMFGVTALTGYVVGYMSSFPALLFFELVIATIGTIATCTWTGLGVLIQKFYLRHFRVINIILALTLLECICGMLR